MSYSSASGNREASTPQATWKSELRRRIGTLLLIKLAALIALWSLFFSPDHRVHVTGQTMSGVLGVDDSSRSHKELPDG